MSGFGGLVSSASATAAAANMVHQGTLTSTLGGLGAVVAFREHRELAKEDKPTKPAEDNATFYEGWLGH